MKILIDEQLPIKLKSIFLEAGFAVSTVRDMNWLGTKNGHLLELMLQYQFNVLLTNDKNLYYQQKIASLKVCILNINAKTNRYEHVLDVIDQINSKLIEIEEYLTHASGGYFIVR